MKSGKVLMIKKVLFEIGYLLVVIVGGGLVGYYLSRHGVEYLNSADGKYESFYQETYEP